MSDVIFNIRCEKNKFTLKMQTPTNISEFIEKLKDELKVEEMDELVVLCPTPEEKMMEINTDDDIEFLNKTKLRYNAVSKEIFCHVELVVIIIYANVQLPKNLSKQVELLSSQFMELSQSLNTKIEESTSSILRKMRLIQSENVGFDSDLGPIPRKASMEDLSDKQKVQEFTRQATKSNKEHKKPIKTKKEKCSINSASSSTTNESLTNNLNQQQTSETDLNSTEVLLEMLKHHGFTNTIQNIIVLKRFDNDFDKALNYLKLNV